MIKEIQDAGSLHHPFFGGGVSYNLSAIIAVGYKVNSERAVQFRKWATIVVKEFTIKGFAMDDERLKEGGTILSQQYFEEQLQRVREIRLSVRKFYQKITDIYATAIDYDVEATATKRFFATVPGAFHLAGYRWSSAFMRPTFAPKPPKGGTPTGPAPHLQPDEMPLQDEEGM